MVEQAKVSLFAQVCERSQNICDTTYPERCERSQKQFRAYQRSEVCIASSYLYSSGMLSRRTFLRAVGASAGAALLAACGGATTTLGVYLSRVYAAASVPDELLEAARIDGSGEVRTFESLAQA
jgi:hypothetical protein